MQNYQSEFRNHEFELVLNYMTSKVAEFGMARRYDRLDLADVLLEHDVTTIDRLADVVSLARNLQMGVIGTNAH